MLTIAYKPVYFYSNIKLYSYMEKFFRSCSTNHFLLSFFSDASYNISLYIYEPIDNFRN